MPVRLLVFDLDGTLVDSRRDIADAANDLLAASGAAPLPEAAIGRMVGEGAALLVARAFAAAGVPPPADALEQFLRFYDRRLTRHTRPYPEIPATLAALQERYALAVLTNKPIAATRGVLEGLALARYFAPALVYGGDGPHPRKPDPAGLQQLAAAVDADLTQVWLIGDSWVDWQTARAAGARACLCRYGFGFGNIPPDVMANAPRVIASPSELLSFL